MPDFPKIKKLAFKNFLNKLSESSKNRALLQQIQEKKVNEGYGLSAISIDKYQYDPPFEKIEVKFEVKDDEILSKGLEAFYSKIDNLAKEMGDQKEKLIIKKMEQVTEQTGNIIKTKGGPISPSSILKAFERMEIQFDINNNPILPSIIVHPNDYEKTTLALKKFETNLELQNKFVEIIGKKRKEWLERENNRKLVD